MNILITGATGFLGNNLSNFLIEKGFNLTAIVRESSDLSTLNKNIKIFVYDGNVSNLINFFNINKIEGVIHLASMVISEHKSEEIGDILSSNISFGTEVLEASKKANIKWFINTGTFWQNYESCDYNPTNLYAASKEAFEKIAKYYYETSEFIFNTIKLNDTFGANDKRKKILYYWDKISKSGDTLEMSRGEQIIDMNYIEDVVNAYYLLIEHLSNEGATNGKTYIVTSKNRMSLKELAKVYETTLNKKLNIKWGAKPYRVREVMNPMICHDVIPGWQQKYELVEALKKTYLKG
ncbi:NAD-dependent epimerase/dehydratase family protein [Halarcobacter anaerophilus]|uniref:NAD-dependent epimerase/dehydratase n=1 Tax=Halarcobacter anaerophilus TaxID=877500 RepID=A0A4Q0Y0S4_9BACT|nr:NAD(P)-dependent oxidoreductase [Halarcobacter anaerophilus]QDF30231.1 NAD-dependent epimerase/dehydratase [Halarcobacter anaerophilus]RXJ62209.1 NAD-dependent epimerase/dehydratase [Halarcobacter anaerophilus]